MTTYVCKTCQQDLPAERYTMQKHSRTGKVYRTSMCNTCRGRRDYQTRRNNPERWAKILSYQRERDKQGKRKRTSRSDMKRKKLDSVLQKHGLNKKS